MRFTLYPGCVSSQSTPELMKSTQTVLEAIELDIVEVKGFSCCGAGYLSVAQEALGIAVNIRNLALAGNEDAELITPCSSCYMTMRKAEQAIEKDTSLKEEIKEVLEKHNLDIGRLGRVRHLLEVLTEEDNIVNISSKIKFPLKDLRVAPFYGCHLIRPKEVIGSLSGAERMDSLIEETGANLVQCSTRHQCCGFHIQLEDENAMLDMAGEFLGEARDRGSDLILTSCPLCQIVFDLFQYKIRKRNGGQIRIPILHMAQLVGIALGVGEKAVGLGRNIVSPKNVFSQEIWRGY